MNNKTKTITVVLLGLLFVTLTAVAIITALRLRQVGSDKPVAPNAPESKPQAAEVLQGKCTLSFSVPKSACFGKCTSASDCTSQYSCEGGICVNPSCPTESDCVCPLVGEVSCNYKRTYRDVSGNTAGHYDLSSSNLLSNGATVARDQKLVFAVTMTNTGEVNKTGVVMADDVPSQMEYVDGESGCSLGGNGVTVTCTVSIAAKQTVTKAFRVKVKGNAGAGSITNTAKVTVASDSNSCQTSVEVVLDALNCNSTCYPNDTDRCPSGYVCDSGSTKCRNNSCLDETDCTCPESTPTPTPTPNPNCNDVCTVNADCPNDLVCETSSGRCRNASCSSDSDCVCATPTPTPTLGCNDYCDSDDDKCPSGMSCDSDSGRCRNNSCTDESDCVCPSTVTYTPTPTPVTLPKAGGIAPSVWLVIGGVMLLGLGMVLVGI